ncbi:MAG: fibronectin type III domain-containing protein [Candidatus Electrothrix sp. GM3_4]|nr:fibronectin type III domain-containing protein [Candidatus Electrothrix sp. GM3_4]
MGAIAPKNWLPRLSNGKFLGPRPANLAQRHQDLHETFADSWRVDETSSLFDYEPGLTPNSFVVPGWPVSAAQSCLAPAQPGVPVPTAPTATAMGQAQAEELCASIVDLQRRKNCIQDVMAMGDPIFAETYLQSQKLDQRRLRAPVAPIRTALTRKARNLELTAELAAELPINEVAFEWSPVPGTEDVDVTYYHCLWSSAERYDFNKCKVLSDPTSVSIKNLKGGERYSWKVVTETKDGLITESETLQFTQE